jgi:hypothetical protein
MNWINVQHSAAYTQRKEMVAISLKTLMICWTRLAWFLPSHVDRLTKIPVPYAMAVRARTDGRRLTPIAHKGVFP